MAHTLIETRLQEESTSPKTDFVQIPTSATRNDRKTATTDKWWAGVIEDPAVELPFVVALGVMMAMVYYAGTA